MGFGHPVYKEGDPRVPILRRIAEEICREKGGKKDVCEKSSQENRQGFYQEIGSQEISQKEDRSKTGCQKIGSEKEACSQEIEQKS